jgi:small conductance mechanosensitive channel
MKPDIENTTQVVTSKLQGWWDTLISNLPNIGIALVVLLLSYGLARLIYNLVLKVVYKKVHQTAVTKLVARASAIAVVLMGLFLALSALNLGKTVTGLLTGAGISGIIIGLALQGTLSNTIAGIVLSFRKSIKYGNWIETNGFAGEVIDIKLSTLTLKEADNNIVVIPNKAIMENPFKNYSLTKKMRVSLNCGVAYSSDLSEVKSITTEVINKHFNQEEIDETVEFYFTEFGDSSINFLARFWIYGENGLAKLRAKSEVMMKLKEAFDKAEITIPFPQRTLHLAQDQTLSKKLRKWQPEEVN